MAAGVFVVRLRIVAAPTGTGGVAGLCRAAALWCVRGQVVSPGVRPNLQEWLRCFSLPGKPGPSPIKEASLY
jgi:hypothetical protein